MSAPSRATRFAAVLLAIALVATACGGDDDDSSSGTSGGGGGGGAQVSTATPKPGGKLIMGVEAEVDGFDPTQNRMDVTGLTYASTVYDPLGTFGKDGKVHPYLAESIDHNPTYTEWTVKLRPNVKFSNGDPLTSDDVVAGWNAHLKSPLTSPAIVGYLKTITKVDDLTAKFTMAGPWVPFPIYLTGQLGFVFSRKMLADPKNSPRNPIGTGPFVLKEWVPGNHMIATKNPNYWREGLPYLDEVELRPIVETQSRESSLRAGTIDLMHSSDVQTVKNLKDDKSVASITDENAAGEKEEHFIMLNTAKPPLNDVRVRRALAYATDRERRNQTIDFGLVPDTTGPFGKGSAFEGDTGYPNFDLQKAKDLVAEYKKEKGLSSLTFELGTTNTGRNLQDMSLMQSMWKDAGIDVTIKQVQQSQYILNALNGAYDAYDWRQFGEPDPDADFVWWTSQTASPIGQLALNFARNKDPMIDAALLKGRTSEAESDRKAAYQEIAKRFGSDDVPYIWLSGTIWQIAFKPKVTGITNWTLPDNTPGIDRTLGGWFLLSHVGVN